VIQITGTIVNYYFHCITQMYLFYHKINLEENSEDVRVGRVLHEINETRVYEVSFEGIKVDKITKDFVVEVKKSDSNLESAKWQLLFYLYSLKQKGIKKRGKLEIIEKKKQNKKHFIIELTQDIEKKIIEVLEDIENILNLKTPPKPKFESRCKKCAYYEYCFL